MNYSKITKRIIALLIAGVFGALTLQVPEPAFAAGTSDVPEQALENSWRYSNGEFITDIEGMEDETEMAESDIQKLPKIMQLGLFGATKRTPWCKDTDGYFYNTRDTVVKDSEGHKAYKKGLDISSHQGNIDWEKLSRSDVDFVIIRCGYGMDQADQDDTKWERNVKACEKYGIPYGVYLYSYATNTTRARSEAEHTLRLLKGHYPQYPVYLDMEDSSTTKVGADKLAKIADTYCKIIEKEGYRAGVYANTSWWNHYLTNDAVFDKYERWLAQYYYKPPSNPHRIWQCSSSVSGKEYGVSYSNVDVNMEYLLDDSETWMDGIGTTVIKASVTDISDYEAVITGDKVNARYGPGQGYLVRSQLNLETRVVITHTANGYGRISAPETAYDGAWVSLDYTARLTDIKGFELRDGQKVCVRYNGSVVSNQWVKVNEKYFYVDSRGIRYTGFHIIDGKRYYFGTDGVARSKKWVKVDGKKYYLTSKGKVAKGYKKIDKYYYGFNAKGVMVTGKHKIDGKKRLFCKNGKAVLYSVKVTTDKLYYRGGPGTKYSIKGSVKKGRTLKIIRKTSNGKWGQTSKNYWVRLKYTKKIKK